MRNLSRREIRHFVFSLTLAAAGLSVSLVYAAGMRGTNVELTIAFVVAYMLVDAMSVRLARGDTVFVDGAIALASVILLPPPQAVISCLLGVALGATFDIHNRKPLVVRLGEIMRRPLLVAALAVLAGATLDLQALANGQTGALVWALGLGIVHSVADFVLLVVDMSLERHVGIVSSVPGLARSLAALYAAHASLGVVAALLFPGGRVWALGVMVVLVLLIQYSFSLLLKTKGAYGETIQALVRASELQLGTNEEGHAQRVADVSVRAGRLLGLPSKALERLNYAALLHEIGLIGLDEEIPLSGTGESHPTRGAEIVGGIPFLASTQEMIRHQALQPPPEQFGLDEETSLCAQLIGVCCALDRCYGSNLMSRSEMCLAETLATCAPLAEPKVLEAIRVAFAGELLGLR